MSEETDTANPSLDSKARLAAGKAGLVAQRQRGRQAARASGDPRSRGFCLLDPEGNCVAGDGYTLSAEDVIRYCERIPD